MLTVNQAELGQGVADVRVTVEGSGDTVGGPSGVSHRGLAEEHLLHVDLNGGSIANRGVAAGLAGEGGSDRLGDVFAESGNLANFLEEDEG